MQDRPLFYDPTEHRIKSFVTRAGRLSPAQAKAIATLGPQFCIPYTKAPLDFSSVFSQSAPTILEIGTGMGETTAHIAAHMPEKNFIGVEVHTPGIGSLLKRIDENQLTNLRLIQHDAVEVLTHMIAPASLSCVHVFFPDPWHKKRHHKRRLIQTEFIQLLVKKIKPGGFIHCATDWQDYAKHILDVLFNPDRFC
jgi:tRNA (guanine-N7-)-methyltransferase